MTDNKKPKAFILVLGPKCFVHHYGDGLVTFTHDKKHAYQSFDTGTLYLYKSTLKKLFGLNVVMVPTEKK